MFSEQSRKEQRRYTTKYNSYAPRSQIVRVSHTG